MNAPFYIGTTNIYDYQQRSGIRRWNTYLASLRVGVRIATVKGIFNNTIGNANVKSFSH